MTSSSVLKVQKNLLLPPGTWQLFTYGRLSSMPTAKQAIWIKGGLRRVLLNQRKEVVEWTDEVVWRDLPVGELVTWEVGSIFHTETLKVSRPQPIAPQIELCEVQVAFTNQNCRLIRRFERDAKGNHLFRNPRLLPEDPETNTYLLQVKCESGKMLLIPCTTVLQSFWGRSSNLIHMLLDSRFTEFDRYVVNTTRSHWNKTTGEARLWLRQWSLDSDARFIAALAFDEEAVARGKEIATRLQAAEEPDSGDPVRCIAALPPHSDLVTLKVWGYELNTTQGTYLYAQRLIQTSYRPKFSKLVFDRDNDGRPTPSGNSEEEGGGGRREPPKPINRSGNPKPRNESSSEFEMSSDHPGLNSTGDTTDLGRFDSVCPGISELPAEKLPQLETEFENNDEAEKARTDRWNKLSTLPGVNQSSAGALGTVLASGSVLNDPIDASTKPAGPPLGQLLEQVIEHAPFSSKKLIPARAAHMDIKPVFPWRPSLAHDGHWLFSLPEEYDDYSWAWLYSDPDQEDRKRGLCLRVTYFDSTDFVMGTGYMVEVEGRFARNRQKQDSAASNAETNKRGTKPKSNPVLFIWRQSATQSEDVGQSASIDKKDLQDLIIGLVSESGASATDTAAKRGIRCMPKRHGKDGVQLAQLLSELLDCVALP